MSFSLGNRCDANQENLSRVLKILGRCDHQTTTCKNKERQHPIRGHEKLKIRRDEHLVRQHFLEHDDNRVHEAQNVTQRTGNRLLRRRRRRHHWLRRSTILLGNQEHCYDAGYDSHELNQQWIRRRPVLQN